MHNDNASSEKVSVPAESLSLEDLEAIGTRMVAFDRQEPGEWLLENQFGEFHALVGTGHTVNTT